MMYEIKLVADGGKGALSVHNIRSSGNAESIIRGFIHSGYQITITEVEDHERGLKKRNIESDGCCDGPMEAVPFDSSR